MQYILCTIIYFHINDVRACLFIYMHIYITVAICIMKNILCCRFRVLLSTILVSPDRAETIVLACCVLHNMLRTRYPSFTQNLLDTEHSVTHEINPGLWRDEATLHNLEIMRGNNATKAGKAQRDYLCTYFNSPAGSVSWQDKMI